MICYLQVQYNHNITRLGEIVGKHMSMCSFVQELSDKEINCMYLTTTPND